MNTGSYNQKYKRNLAIQSLAIGRNDITKQKDK